MRLNVSVATKRTPAEQYGISYLEQNQDHVFATWRNLMIASWVGRTSTVAVTRLSKNLERLHAVANEPLGLIQVVSQRAPAPDSVTRGALQMMLHSRGDVIACSSVVSPGSGFRAASVRALITGLMMLARPTFPHVLHATIDETARWHSTHLQSKSGPLVFEEIRSVLRVICATSG